MLFELVTEVNEMNQLDLALKVQEIEKQRGNIEFSQKMLQRAIDCCYDRDLCSALKVDYANLPPQDYRKVFVYAYLTLGN